MAGMFEIAEDKVGKFRYGPKGGNSEIVAASEADESRASAQKGIASVQKYVPGATIIGLTE